MRPLKKRTAPPQKGSITVTLGELKFYLKPSFELAMNFVRSEFREARYQLIESAIYFYMILESVLFVFSWLPS